MKRMHQGNARSKCVQLQGFWTEFENLRMKSRELVTDFFIKNDGNRQQDENLWRKNGGYCHY